MKKIILLAIATLSLALAQDSVEFKYAPKDMQRQNPTSQNYILSYNNILENVKSSVVNISTSKTLNNQSRNSNPYMNDPFFREFFKHQRQIPHERIQRALGSGVIISEDGYIVTNNHVVDNVDVIKVTIAKDKKEYIAKLIGKDAKSDLAIIKIEADDLNAVTFYDSDEVKVGDIVFALGNPFGVGQTITQGIVSATKRTGVGIVEYENFIQTDASINPGNSGGALINSAGHLIGINSAILSKSGGNVGIGFSIPSNMVTSIATELINKGRYSRAYLGVNISDVSNEMSEFYNGEFGALVTAVEDNTPAFKAGLKRGDLIISVNGKKITSGVELKNSIGSFQPKRVINIKFLRDKKIDIVNVSLGSSDEKVTTNDKTEYKGLKIVPLSSSMKQELGTSVNGVVVMEVENESPAQKSDIKKGDIIIQIENSEISTLSDFKRLTASQDKKRFFIYRRGAIFAVVL